MKDEESYAYAEPAPWLGMARAHEREAEEAIEQGDDDRARRHADRARQLEAMHGGETKS